MTAKVEPLTELEIEGYYQANKRRLRGDEATIRQNARGHLQQQEKTLSSGPLRLVSAERRQRFWSTSSLLRSCAWSCPWSVRRSADLPRPP